MACLYDGNAGKRLVVFANCCKHGSRNLLFTAKFPGNNSKMMRCQTHARPHGNLDVGTCILACKWSSVGHTVGMVVLQWILLEHVNVLL